MLVLTRKIGESVAIGHDVEISVVGLSGGQVRLGFVAPSHVRIWRKELLDELNAQNQNAAESQAHLKKLAKPIGPE